MHLLTSLALLSTVLAIDVTLILPAYHPDPLSLPPSTHATLSSLGQRFSAPISAASTFVFRNVTPGSYLADVHCATDGFRPLRIDVGGGDVVLAWETYRGNDWDNKGEAIPLIETETVKGFQVQSVGSKLYFTERPKFSIMTIFGNPMILMGIVSMVIFIGMPKLVENMDPETRAEFEASQKNSAMNAFLTGNPGSDAKKNPLNNFDMAAYLAGSNKKEAPAEAASKVEGVKR